MNILDLMKRGARVPEDEQEEKTPAIGPCVVCGKPAKRFCGICHRLSDGQKTVPICLHTTAECQAIHAKTAHGAGQIGENDPHWRG